MKAEEILEMHFGSEFWQLEEFGYKTNIVNAMQEYARIQIQKDRSEKKRLMNEKLKDFEGLNPEIEAIIDREINLD
jgi:hypothetical protein